MKREEEEQVGIGESIRVFNEITWENESGRISIGNGGVSSCTDGEQLANLQFSPGRCSLSQGFM